MHLTTCHLYLPFPQAFSLHNLSSTHPSPPHLLLPPLTHHSLQRRHAGREGMEEVHHINTILQYQLTVLF